MIASANCLLGVGKCIFTLPTLISPVVSPHEFTIRYPSSLKWSMPLAVFSLKSSSRIVTFYTKSLVEKYSPFISVLTFPISSRNACKDYLAKNIVIFLISRIFLSFFIYKIVKSTGSAHFYAPRLLFSSATHLIYISVRISYAMFFFFA